MPKSSETFNEMLRLYREEHLSLEQIGNRFGIKRQAVYDRFKRAGIKLRPNNQVRIVVKREILVKLYAEDHLTIGQIAAKLNISFAKISAELDRHGIYKRALNAARRKHPELWQMQAGEILIVSRPVGLQPHVTLYEMAKKAGIKISIKTIEPEKMCITCLSVVHPRLKAK